MKPPVRTVLVLRELGVHRPDLDARLRLSGKAPDLVPRLDVLIGGAAFVLGDSLVAFDQSALGALHSTGMRRKYAPPFGTHRSPRRLNN